MKLAYKILTVSLISLAITPTLAFQKAHLDILNDFESKVLTPEAILTKRPDLQQSLFKSDSSDEYREWWDKHHNLPLPNLPHIYEEDGVEYVDSSKRNDTLLLYLSQDVSPPLC